MGVGQAAHVGQTVSFFLTWHVHMGRHLDLEQFLSRFRNFVQEVIP